MTGDTGSNYVGLEELPEIDLPPLDRNRETSDDFVSDLVDVSNCVRKYLILVAGIRPSANLDSLVEGVLIGHAVRLFKLYDQLCYMVSRGHGDFTIAVARMIADTVINLRYLLANPTRSDVDLYIRATLAMEKKLILEVQARIHQPPLAIEQRLIRDARGFFDRAGVNPDDVKPGEWRWIDSGTKAVDLGLDSIYEFSFRGASHSIHGTWHDLYYQHLVEVDGRFRPKIRYSVPRPQILDSTTVLILDTCKWYLSLMVPEVIDAPLFACLSELDDWFRAMSSLHEVQRSQE